MTEAEAAALLRNCDLKDLRESCYDSHKDFYGVKGRHLLTYSRDELLAWWRTHFYWSELYKAWAPTVPFDNHDGDYEPYDYDPDRERFNAD